MSERRGDWIQTATGRQAWPLDPRPEDVDIADIAHALSQICRFTGHCHEFYSVAQHAVLVSLNVPPEHAAWALLHDAAEAYIGDISRPLKRHLWAGPERGCQLPSEPVKETEERLLMVIGRRFGLSVSAWKAAKPFIDHADMLLLATEARDLMAPLHPAWHHQWLNGYPVLPDPIQPVAPLLAKFMFLERFTELGMQNEPLSLTGAVVDAAILDSGD